MGQDAGRPAGDIFHDFIAAKGFKMTSQRMHILDVFLKKEGHLSPEELYSIVKTKYPSIGRATVYRVLKLLKEAGLANQVDFGDGYSRYEHKYGHAHHDHLICVSCGKAIEVVDEEIEKLQEKLAARYGFALEGHKMDLFGLCPSCLKKKKS
ncbi:MAG: Fur family transcriptional regulator [Actinomycetota bacterium]|nr:Fur family transcriptional regulator [Actinomycetota bacterium]